MTQTESRSTMNIVEVIVFLHKNNHPQTALNLILQMNDDTDPIICDYSGNMDAKFIHWYIGTNLFLKMQDEVTTTVWS